MVKRTACFLLGSIEYTFTLTRICLDLLLLRTEGKFNSKLFIYLHGLIPAIPETASVHESALKRKEHGYQPTTPLKGPLLSSPTFHGIQQNIDCCINLTGRS